MKQIIDTVKKELNKCDCSAPTLNESLQHKMPISEAMRYHLNKQIQIHENIFRPGSKAHIELFILADKPDVSPNDTFLIRLVLGSLT